MPGTESDKSKRIFLALWPDESTRQQLFKVQQQLRKEPDLRSASIVIPENLHMTLHFIGSVSPEVVKALEHSLNSVQCNGFELKVNTAGCFSKARVFWLGLKNVPSRLEELERTTALCIRECVENYQLVPYRPHITLFRKVKTSMEQAIFPEISWQVKSFSLVESKTYPEGVQYRVLKDWLLS